MMHRAWSSILKVPYCFSRSYVKFQGNTALKIVEFDPNWAFPDCNSSLNSPMAMKCCTKLETAKERCPIVFKGHPSNFNVTRDKTSPILTQIGRFRTIGRSQLSNPSDLPCLASSIKYQGHTAWNNNDLNSIWVRLLGRSQLSNPSDLPWFCLLGHRYLNYLSSTRLTFYETEHYSGNILLFTRTLLSQPSLGWLNIFNSFPPPPPQLLLLLTSKLFQVNLKYLGQRK